MRAMMRILEVNRTCDVIDVTSSLPQPDPRWSFVDRQGHVVTWKNVAWVVAGTGFDEDGEERDTGEYRCPECGEVVRPATRVDSSPRFIPGMRRTFVKVAGDGPIPNPGDTITLTDVPAEMAPHLAGAACVTGVEVRDFEWFADAEILPAKP